MKEIRKTDKELKKVLTKGEKYAINKYILKENLFSGFYYNEEMIEKVKELWNVK